MPSYWSRFSRSSGAGSKARASRVDTSELRARLMDLRARVPAITRIAALEMNALLAERVAETSPRDTNRFVRGWLLAAMDVGPITVAVPNVAASARHSEYVDYLNRELRRAQKVLQGIVAVIDLWYTSKPNRRRNTPAYRELERKRKKQEKWIGRITEELKKLNDDPSALLFDKERGNRNYSTVRTGVHGGRGVLVRLPGKTVVRWHNLEAHATIIERKYGIIRNALGATRAAGVSRMQKKIARELTRAA